MIVLRISAILLAAALITGAALAVMPGEQLEDPALEARARAITAELRCLVCQNESIDASNAPLARDLRLLVRERILAGDSDEEVFAFAVARYGDFVLLRPPVRPDTWALWFGPFAVLLLGIVAAAMVVRARSAARPGEPAPAERGLDPHEEAALAALLAERRAKRGD